MNYKNVSNSFPKGGHLLRNRLKISFKYMYDDITIRVPGDLVEQPCPALLTKDSKKIRKGPKGH
jgi:hypothetical protein